LNRVREMLLVAVKLRLKMQRRRCHFLAARPIASLGPTPDSRHVARDPNRRAWKSGPCGGLGTPPTGSLP
jgi:hypothetical protein